MLKRCLQLDDSIEIRVKSLASSGGGSSRKTATFDLSKAPHNLLLTDDEMSLYEYGSSDGPVMDTHFVGMTPLHSDENGACFKVESVHHPRFISTF